MSEVDIEASAAETEHTISDINVALIPLFLVSLAFTGGYYIISFFTTHEREPIPSFVDFLELYDCNWPSDSTSESFNITCTDDQDSKTPLEQCSQRLSGPGDGLVVGLGIAQESAENGLPCELVVAAHTPCFPEAVNVVQKPPRLCHFRHHRHVYHQWPQLRMPPALSHTGPVVTIITASGAANKPFNVLVGEPAYFNTTL